MNVVRAVIEQKRSLESVWGNESKKLRPPDRRWFRDLCSGALRNWHRLDAELAPIVAKEAFLEGGKAKRGVDDPELRALMVLALYEGRHMDSSPPLAESEKTSAASVRGASAGGASIQKLFVMVAGRGERGDVWSACGAVSRAPSRST